MMMSEKITYDPALVSAFQDVLLEVYQIVRPKPCDYERRRCLFQIFSTMVKDIFGSNGGFPIVQTFGSFTMDLFTEGSDLDLSINFNNDTTLPFPHNRKVGILRRFAGALYAQQRKRHVLEVLPLLKARIPTIKVVDRETGIGCDITVENKNGISKSLILKIVSSLDGRFRILCYLMKVWARAQGINSSQHNTLNSLSIVTLAAVHLQTRDPPILPPFSTLLKGGTDLSSLQKTVSGFKNFSRSNQESVSELFNDLLRKLATVEKSWEHGLCASAFEGSWIYKKLKSEASFMSVEDFLDRSENCARAVKKDGMQKIYWSVWSSCYHLSRFMEGQIEASELKKKLFGPILLELHNRQLDHEGRLKRKREYPCQNPVAGMHESNATKKARFSEEVNRTGP